MRDCRNLRTIGARISGHGSTADIRQRLKVFKERKPCAKQSLKMHLISSTSAIPNAVCKNDGVSFEAAPKLYNQTINQLDL